MGLQLKACIPMGQFEMWNTFIFTVENQKESGEKERGVESKSGTVGKKEGKDVFIVYYPSERHAPYECGLLFVYCYFPIYFHIKER